MTEKPCLYSYWRSSCSWRVRFALAFKNIEYDTKPIHLVKDGGEQLKKEYTDINPMKEVPTLIIDGHVLRQSMSILEYIEERFPLPALLPKKPEDRAKVRELAECIASGIQPLQNLRVCKKVGDDKKMEWSHYWIDYGFQALEKVLEETAGKHCFGDDLSFADLCLAPQVYNAIRFKVDVPKYPNIYRINENLKLLDSYKESEPSNQVDCTDKN